jgi:hypothetical protein
MMHSRLFTMELLNAVSDFENDRLDGEGLAEEIKSLIAYHEQL